MDNQKKTVYTRGDYAVQVWPNWIDLTTWVGVNGVDGNGTYCTHSKDSPSSGWIVARIEECREWVDARVSAEEHNLATLEAVLELEDIFEA